MNGKALPILNRAGERLLRFARCAVLVIPAFAALTTDAVASFVVFESAAADPAGLTPTRDAFRTAVGGGDAAGPAGNFGGLRREINWDGVPDAISDPALMPANFFNVNSPRGAVFSTPGTGFMVSAPGTLFGFPLDLQTFSPAKLFAIVGSRTMDIQFFVPGTNVAATTSAFGAIFVDAEDNNATNFTNMEFFDPLGNSIFSRTVLAGSNQGLSFLGGVANAGERIGRVRITTPDNFLLSNRRRANETTDFVVMDDFLYATPAVVAEPETMALTLLGLALVGWRSRKRG